METSNSSNNFLEYINKIFTPCCIVYSTEEVKRSIQKNNLRPAEFLRPFGNFTGFNITFSFGDKFTTNIKNFRIDFHDSDKFKSYNPNLFNEALDLVLAYNTPDWDYKQVKYLNIILKYKNNKNPNFKNNFIVSKNLIILVEFD